MKRIYFILFLSTVFCINPAIGAQWYASPSGTNGASCTIDDPGTIQACVDKAANGTAWSNGCSVVLLSGTYDYSDTIWSGKNCVLIPKNKNYITIKSMSGNPEDVVIRGRGIETFISDDLSVTNAPFFSRALYSNSIVGLDGITFTNFYFNQEASVASSASARHIYISNCIIAGNHGAGVPAVYRPAVITGSLFSGNENVGGRGGAINCARSALYVTNSVFACNRSTYSAVAENVIGEFVNCIVSNNSATVENGGISGADGVVTFENCHIVRNCSAKNGFAYFRRGIFTNCVVEANCATNSENGVFYTYAGWVNCYNTTFMNNWATNRYGIGGPASAYNCLVSGNSAYLGTVGGFYLSGNTTLRDCVFTNNYSGENGGAVGFANGSSPVVTNCLFINNYAKKRGGALTGHPQKAYDTLFIGNEAGEEGGAVNYGGSYFGCRFLRNKAPRYGASNAGYTYRNCEFIENEASGSGGAVNAGNFRDCLFLRNKAKTSGAFSSYNSTIRNCVFIENVAEDDGIGAGIGTGMFNCLFMDNETTGTTKGLFYYGTFYNCTFIRNKTGGKPFFGNSGGIVNCIFTENLPYDISGNRTYINCLYGTKTGSAPMTDCIMTSDPGFNMGYNPKLADYAPGRWSKARDAGLWQSWATNDVDLSSRVRINKVIDIGCYEYWPHGMQTIFSVK